jgi:hypothetical protein
MKHFAGIVAVLALGVAGCAMGTELLDYDRDGKELVLIDVEADPPLFDDMIIMLQSADWFCVTTAGELRAGSHVCPGTIPEAVEWSVERSAGFEYAEGYSVITDGAGRIGEDGLWIVYAMSDQ